MFPDLFIFFLEKKNIMKSKLYSDKNNAVTRRFLLYTYRYFSLVNAFHAQQNIRT